MVSMDATKIFPASTWRGERFRKDIAAVPDSNPRVREDLSNQNGRMDRPVSPALHGRPMVSVLGISSSIR